MKPKEKTEVKLKKFLSELDYVPKVERKRCLNRISRAKCSLIENSNYVGIIYISRFLDYDKRDILFRRFLERHPEDFLFVLAFADSGSEAYVQAEEIADLAYEQDIHSIRDSRDKIHEEYLSSFLGEYSTKEDLKWASDLIEKKDWFKSYEVITSKLIELENSSM